MTKLNMAAETPKPVTTPVVAPAPAPAAPAVTAPVVPVSDK